MLKVARVLWSFKNAGGLNLDGNPEYKYNPFKDKAHIIIFISDHAELKDTNIVSPRFPQVLSSLASYF